MACSIYNNIHHPSKLAVGADFRCFKNKIKPKWEDAVCSNGGNWTVCYSRVVNVRTKQEKIALWTKNAANEAAQLSIGRHGKSFGVTRIPWVSYSMKRQRGLTEVPRIVTLRSCLRTRRGTRNTIITPEM